MVFCLYYYFVYVVLQCTLQWNRAIYMYYLKELSKSICRLQKGRKLQFENQKYVNCMKALFLIGLIDS